MQAKLAGLEVLARAGLLPESAANDPRNPVHLLDALDLGVGDDQLGYSLYSERVVTKGVVVLLPAVEVSLLAVVEHSDRRSLEEQVALADAAPSTCSADAKTKSVVALPSAAIISTKGSLISPLP